MRLLSLLMMSMLVGCSTAKEWRYPPLSEQDKQSVYLVDHGWHTGIVVPANALNAVLPFLARDFPNARFYEVGWGDYDFYQAEENTLGLALQALIWPGDGVLHIAGFSIAPERYFYGGEVLALSLSNEAMTKLQHFIRDAFVLPGQGNRLREGLYGDSHFYSAKGTFHLFNTCNSWVAEGLDRAGVPISTFLTITSGNVLRQTREAMLSNSKVADKETR